jgi:hypothetical protein
MKKLSLIFFMLLFVAMKTDTRFSGCTVITISKGDSVFFGGNDDYIEKDSYYWVEKGDSAKYGVIWIGTPDNPQQGVNEKGLAYDANGLPRVDVNPHTERIPVPGEYHNYLMQIMHECSTVEEVINWINSHQRHSYMHDQMHFADRTGDAVIISAARDGEMVFTRKVPGDGFLVSTNFNVANPSHGFGYPCWRYDKARELLGDLMDKDAPLTYRDATGVLEAVHVEKGGSWTIATLVVDLTNGIIYLYYFYQYDRPVVIHVQDELADPREAGPLSRLFPEDVRQEATRRYNKAQAGLRVNKVVGITWPSLVIVSLILLFAVGTGYKRDLKFWLPAVIVLGPVALIAGYIAEKRCKASFCRTAVIETLGSLMALVVSYTVALVIVILNMLAGNLAWYIQVITMFSLPLMTAWLFHLALLGSVSSKTDRFLVKCLPQVLVTTFLGLGGIIAVSMPLVNNNLNMELLMPLSPLAVTTWLALVVLGALLGGFFIYLFERGLVKSGFQSWTLLTQTEGELTVPTWRRLRWWILIGFLVLIAGLFTGAALAS